MLHASPPALVSCIRLLYCAGLLAAVGDLTLSVQDTETFVNWTAPFTLDISNEEDDISGYCIDVINITSSSSLFSQCGINTTQISLPLSLDDACHVNRVTVSPENVVGRGERNAVIYSQIESRMGIKLSCYNFFVYKYKQIGLHTEGKVAQQPSA